VIETRGHNAVHELLASDAASLSYDPKGNLTQNRNAQIYTWDNENRLATATVPVGCPDGIEGTHTYKYDALGRRVAKTVDGVTTVFVNNADWQEIAEYQGATLIQSYVFGTYIDEVLCMQKADSTRYYYSTNDLYSVYALTDSTGTVVERYMFDPYGKVTVLEPDGVTVRAESAYGNPLTFTGRRLDGETGLMYFRVRMYHAGLGRFVSRDPIGYVDGMGLYGAYFVPFAVDPSGTVVITSGKTFDCLMAGLKGLVATVKKDKWARGKRGAALLKKADEFIDGNDVSWDLDGYAIKVGGKNTDKDWNVRFDATKLTGTAAAMYESYYTGGEEIFLHTLINMP